MADITTYPLQDDFETTLAQSWSGGTGTVYLNAAPDFTFPSGVTTYIVVNPGKSNMQVAEINALDTSAKTVTVSSISVNKGASLAYSQQTHAVGSIVRISNNFAFWSDVVDAINSKVDTNDQIDFNYYATVAARDADLTSPVIGKDYAFCLDTGLLYQYTGSGWVAFDTGTVTANASATVAGKVEIATTAEFDAGTDTGGTGAELVVAPSDIQGAFDTVVGDAATAQPDTTADYLIFDDATDSTRKKVLIDDFRDDVPASVTQKGFVELLTDAEADTGTDTTRYVNSKQLKTYGSPTKSGTTYVAANASTQIQNIVNTSYEQKKVLTVNKGGTYNTEFVLQVGSALATLYGRIYVNGSPVGTERTQVGIGTTSFTEDITVAPGDTLEVRCKVAGTTSNEKLNYFKAEFDFDYVEVTTDT